MDQNSGVQNSNIIHQVNQLSDTPTESGISWHLRFSLILATVTGIVILVGVTLKSPSFSGTVGSQVVEKPQAEPERNQPSAAANLPPQPWLAVPARLPLDSPPKKAPPTPIDFNLTSPENTPDQLLKSPMIYPDSAQQFSPKNSSVFFFNLMPQSAPQSPNLTPESSSINLPISTFFLTQTTEQNSPPSQPQLSTPALPETPQPPSETLPSSSGTEVLLTLSDVIFLVLENNRDIKNQYLQRIVERADLAVAEDKFVPNFTPTLSLLGVRERTGNRTRGTGNFNATADVSMKLPTGGEIRLQWNALRSRQTTNNPTFFSTQNSLGQNITLSVNQPLLRGAGIELNQASIKIARLTDQFNKMALKNLLIDTLTNAIFAYRDLIQGQKRLDIALLSLKDAQKQLEDFQFLIDIGREAKVDIVTNETNVANQKIAVLDAQNSLERIRLALLQILDIDQNIRIIPEDIPPVDPQIIDLKSMLELALINRPDYLQENINQEQAKYAVLLAEDRKRWNLDIVASYQNDLSNLAENRSDLKAGITLSHEFGDLSIDRDIQRARVSLSQAENKLVEKRQQIEIEVENAVRDVNVKLEQVALAKKARELAQRQLEIGQEKLKLGVGDTSNLDVVRFQTELIQASNAELAAKIDYLNALTNLEKTVGTTLEMWQITVEDESGG